METKGVYTQMLISAIVFAMLSVFLMVVFKQNEYFFDNHGKIVIQAESSVVDDYDAIVNKLLFKKKLSVNLVEKNLHKLIIPTDSDLSKEQIVVESDMLKKKVILTIVNAGECVKTDADITIDADVMRAVGAYTQQDSIIFEIYTKQLCDYTIDIVDDCIELTLYELREEKQGLVIFNIAESEYGRFVVGDYFNRIEKLAKESNSIFFSTTECKEKYDESEVLTLANESYANLLVTLNMVYDTNEEAVMIVCNDDYFIPGFDSVAAANIFKNSFVKKGAIQNVNIVKATSNYNMVMQAKVPAIEIIIYAPHINEKSVEYNYSFNHNMLEAIEDAVKEYFQIIG